MLMEDEPDPRPEDPDVASEEDLDPFDGLTQQELTSSPRLKPGDSS